MLQVKHISKSSNFDAVLKRILSIPTPSIISQKAYVINIHLLKRNVHSNAYYVFHPYYAIIKDSGYV